MKIAMKPPGPTFRAVLSASRGLREPLALRCTYRLVCRDALGRLKWQTPEFANLVTTAGENMLGNVMFGATAKSAVWYVGLKGVGTAALADTAASHAGWSEFTGYSQGARQTLSMAAWSSGTSSNASSPAVFTVNAAGTVAGAFLVDSSTKGGAGGTLYSVGDFSSALPVEIADTLTVPVTIA